MKIRSPLAFMRHLLNGHMVSVVGHLAFMALGRKEGEGNEAELFSFACRTQT